MIEVDFPSGGRVSLQTPIPYERDNENFLYFMAIYKAGKASITTMTKNDLYALCRAIKDLEAQDGWGL